MLKILFLGDVIGKTGRKALKENLSKLKQQYSADVCIVNGENSAGGLGIGPKEAEELYSAGADIITTGNHVWKKNEIRNFLNKNNQKILRPLNYPAGNPGVGFLIWQGKPGVKLGVVNIQGRVFMPDLIDCPFHAIEKILGEELKECTDIFVDFHAEATSEKVSMGHFLDGKVSAVVGTHTHIQTADERILPDGTAYITDVGMCGPEDSAIGMKKDLVINRFLTAQPARFDVSKSSPVINGVLVSCLENGKAESIERIYLRV